MSNLCIEESRALSENFDRETKIYRFFIPSYSNEEQEQDDEESSEEYVQIKN